MSSLPKALRLLALLALALLGAPGVSSLESRPACEASACAEGDPTPGSSWEAGGGWLVERFVEASEAESEEEGHDGPAPLGGPYAAGEYPAVTRGVRPVGSALHPDRARVRRDLARGPPPARA